MSNDRNLSLLSKRNILIGLGFLVTFFAGILTSDYVNFRGNSRAIITDEMKTVQSVSQDISVLLQKFSQVALGKSSPNPTDIDLLGKRLIILMSRVESLKNRIPESENQYVALTNSMIALKNSAENLSGPKDGKLFVESVSEYYAKKLEFERVVSRYQGTYKLPLT